MIQPFVWTHTFLWLADSDAANLLLNTWAIPTVAVDEEDVGARAIKHLSTMCFCCHIIENFAVGG